VLCETSDDVARLEGEAGLQRRLDRIVMAAIHGVNYGAAGCSDS
jgi:hypothetical protein